MLPEVVSGAQEDCASWLSTYSGQLAAGEVKDLLAEQLQDDHAVLAQQLAGLRGVDYVCDEGGPLAGPVLLQDLHSSGTMSEPSTDFQTAN